MTSGEVLDHKTNIGDPALNRRDIAVLRPGSPPRSRHFAGPAIDRPRLLIRQRLGMSMRQRAPEAERRGDALKRTNAPVHLVVEQLDAEHLGFLTRIEALQLGPDGITRDPRSLKNASALKATKTPALSRKYLLPAGSDCA